MEFIPPLFIAFIAFFSVFFIFKKIEKTFLKKIKYRQSDIHNIFKNYMNIKSSNIKKQSQLSNRLDSSSVNVVILDDRAYWVSNNMFYSADFSNGEVIGDTIKPVDTHSLSKQDVDKMLFILDRLGGRDNNDRGGTR